MGSAIPEALSLRTGMVRPCNRRRPRARGSAALLRGEARAPIRRRDLRLLGAEASRCPLKAPCPWRRASVVWMHERPSCRRYGLPDVRRPIVVRGSRRRAVPCRLVLRELRPHPHDRAGVAPSGQDAGDPRLRVPDGFTPPRRAPYSLINCRSTGPGRSGAGRGYLRAPIAGAECSAVCDRFARLLDSHACSMGSQSSQVAVLKSAARSSTATIEGPGRSRQGFEGNQSVAVAAHVSCSTAG